MVILGTVYHFFFTTHFPIHEIVFLRLNPNLGTIVSIQQKNYRSKTEIGILLKSTYTFSWQYTIKSAKMICPFFYSIRTFKMMMMMKGFSTEWKCRSKRKWINSYILVLDTKLCDPFLWWSRLKCIRLKNLSFVLSCHMFEISKSMYYIYPLGNTNGVIERKSTICTCDIRPFYVLWKDLIIYFMNKR